MGNLTTQQWIDLMNDLEKQLPRYPTNLARQLAAEAEAAMADEKHPNDRSYALAQWIDVAMKHAVADKAGDRT